MRSDHAGSGSHGRQRVHPQEGYLSRQREPLPTRVEGLAPLPDEYHLALDAGLDEIRLVLSPAARAQIEGHVRLLVAWNEAINLTAIRDPAAIATLHVIDSLTAARVVAGLGATSLLDLGSGGGFPGVPLAAASGVGALLVDSVGKKAAFLDVVARAVALPGASARATRAEALAADPGEREAWPLVTARAVAPLAELIELAFPLLVLGGHLIAWKRGDLEAELRAAERALDAVGRGSLDVVDPGVSTLPGHRLVVVRKTAATPPSWPRDPAARRRRPW